MSSFPFSIVFHFRRDYREDDCYNFLFVFTDTFAALQPSTMTDWDKEQEKSEFEQASRIYKPLTGFMSDRY